MKSKKLIKYFFKLIVIIKYFDSKQKNLKEEFKQ